MARNFNGSSDQITFSSLPDVTAHLSVSAWINIPAAQASGVQFTVLAQSDFQNMYNGVRSSSIQAANLKGLWPLEGYTTETDQSGQGFNGTVNGTVVPTIGPPYTWRLG